MRFAVIGRGRWGRAWQQTVERAGHEAAPFGRGFDTTSLQHHDAAIVACATSARRVAARTCLEAGLPTLVEKPFALSVADAEAMIAVGQARSVPVFAGHTYLWHPGFVPLAEEVQLALSRNERASLETVGTGPTAPHVDCPSLLDWGAHDVSMALWAFRGFGPARAQAELVPDAPRAPPHRLRLGWNAGRALLQFGPGPVRIRRVVARLEGRSLFFDDAEREGNPLGCLLDGFVEAICNAVPDPRLAPAFAVEVVQTLEAAARV